MMTMITSTIVLALIIGIFGLGVITTGQQVDASIGSDEFCDDNPSHFACDGKVGSVQDDDNDNDGDHCENPPTAAACNNDFDPRGVEIIKDEEGLSNCYDAGYDDGQNSDFDRSIFHDNCGPLDTDNSYYQGFIDGCMSVEGNTRDVCESATDT